MAAAADGGIAPAFIGIAGAMVIDVAFFLDLADDRATALRAGNKTGEGKIVFHAPRLLGVTAVEDALHAFPQFARDQRLVLTQVKMTIPFKLAHVESIAQGTVHRAHRHRSATLSID